MRVAGGPVAERASPAWLHRELHGGTIAVRRGIRSREPAARVVGALEAARGPVPSLSEAHRWRANSWQLVVPFEELREVHFS